MTHHTPGRGAVPLAPDTISRAASVTPAAAPLPEPRLSREALHLGLALRREMLAELEAEMVAACEAAAGLGDPRTCAPDDRALWDRSTWARYLDAATCLEGSYGPRMRRLRDEIARLERLLDLPVSA